MSYQEKRTITSILSGVIILTAYCIHAISKFQSGTESAMDLRSWAGTMLIFIGVGVAVTIVIQIVFHILLSISVAVKQQMIEGNVDEREIEKTIKAEMIEDEMDKLIELKSNQVGFVIAGIGFATALFALVFGSTPVVMLNIMFVAFSLGSLVEGFFQLYYYRKGV